MVSPRVVITAAFTLYMHDHGGFVKSVTVSPGENGNDLPFGKLDSSEFRIAKGWRDQERLDRAIGAIILPKSLDGTGAFKLRALPDHILTGAIVKLLGYPADRSSGKELFASQGHIAQVTTTGFNHNLFTFGGMSGGPIFYEDTGQTYVLGIHVAGASSSIRAIRINQAAVELIQSWISEFP